MSDDEVRVPPNARLQATLPALLQGLRELREWVETQREWANNLAAEHEHEPVVGVLPEVPTLEQYLLVSVSDHFTAYSMLRDIRKCWDATLAEYETVWDSPAALRMRIRCLRMAISLLENAFTLPEHREAVQHAERQKMYKHAQAMLRKMGLDPSHYNFVINDELCGEEGHEEEAKLTDEDYDALFNPDPPTESE